MSMPRLPVTLLIGSVTGFLVSPLRTGVGINFVENTAARIIGVLLFGFCIDDFDLLDSKIQGENAVGKVKMNT